MKAEISHVVVKDGGIITCQAILSDGSSYSADLPEGRYTFEGHIEHDGRRFLRLRGANGGLKIVAERELARQGRGSVRRIHRKRSLPSEPQAHRKGSASLASVSPITLANRDEVRKGLRRVMPESLAERHLGTYVECGSVDSWKVFYGIERRNGEWIITCEDPGGERDESGFADVEALVEDARDRGYRPEDLIDDLRHSRRRHLITLADEIEEIARAKGCIETELPPADHDPHFAPAAPVRLPNTSTYVDDGGTRFYRHPPAPVRAFEAVLYIQDRADNLTIGTPDGVHEMDVELRAHRQGEMQPVLRVRGQATPEGGLQLVVTNVLTGKSQLVEV